MILIVIRNDSHSYDTNTASVFVYPLKVRFELNFTQFSVVRVGWMGIIRNSWNSIALKLQDLQMDPVEWLDRMLTP